MSQVFDATRRFESWPAPSAVLGHESGSAPAKVLPLPMSNIFRKRRPPASLCGRHDGDIRAAGIYYASSRHIHKHQGTEQNSGNEEQRVTAWKDQLGGYATCGDWRRP